MKLIPLTKGQFAMVDDGNFEWLNSYKWHYTKELGTNGSGYAKRLFAFNGKKGPVGMHRFIMGTFPGGINSLVDHIDGNGLNNQVANLRYCTKHQNLCNKSFEPNRNTSGFKGAVFDKVRKVWIAQIKFNGKNHYLGTFANPLECAKAYNAAALKLHGEFARLNDLSKYEKTQEQTAIPT